MLSCSKFFSAKLNNDSALGFLTRGESFRQVSWYGKKLCTLIHDVEWISAPGFMTRSESFRQVSWYRKKLCTSIHDLEWISAPGFMTCGESFRGVSRRITQVLDYLQMYTQKSKSSASHNQVPKRSCSWKNHEPKNLMLLMRHIGEDLPVSQERQSERDLQPGAPLWSQLPPLHAKGPALKSLNRN
jgi:hypothetical protein